MRFLFIHEGRSEDSIKSFLNDAYEYYVKVRLHFIQALLNPFVDKNTRIFSTGFDYKIRTLVKKHFS